MDNSQLARQRVLTSRLATNAVSVYSIFLVQGRISMAWTTPVLIEICIGLEINGYLPPEF